MARPKKHPDDLIQRGVRQALESERPITHIAADLGVTSEVLRRRVRQHEADSGARPDLPTSAEREEIRRLRKEDYELRRATEILKSASLFRPGARLRPIEVSRYIDSHRGGFGVEPICRVLGVSAFAYYQRKTGRRSARAIAEERLLGRMREVHAANYYTYGSRRMWIALRRAGEPVARCTVERLMRAHAIQGAKRRAKRWKTTRPDLEACRRPDLVRREFSATAPNRLRCAARTPSSARTTARQGSRRGSPGRHSGLTPLLFGRGALVRTGEHQLVRSSCSRIATRHRPYRYAGSRAVVHRMASQAAFSGVCQPLCGWSKPERHADKRSSHR